MNPLINPLKNLGLYYVGFEKLFEGNSTNQNYNVYTYKNLIMSISKCV